MKKNGWLKTSWIFILITFILIITTSPAFSETNLPEPKQGDLLIGYFVPGKPASSDLTTLENLVARESDVVLYYQDWTYGLINQNVRDVFNHGSIPLLTWIPCKAGTGINQPDYQLKDISNGNYDSYIRESARSARDTGKTIWLRPFHEMNGNWAPYSGTVNGNRPEDFVPAWRRIVDIFRQEGANNVLFVWSPNTNSVPNTAENAIPKYFPGDNYIDIIGIDGYNWGTSQSWSHWNSFYDTFIYCYNTVTKLSTKPVIIAETGSSELGGNKAQWIKDAFSSIRNSFPRMKCLIWFNINKETDWRIESSTASINSFKEATAGNPPQNVEEPVLQSEKFFMKFKTQTSQEKISEITSTNNLTILAGPLKNNYYYVESDPGTDFNTISANLAKLMEVIKVDLNHSYRVQNSNLDTYSEENIYIQTVKDNQSLTSTTQVIAEEQKKAESSTNLTANQPFRISPILEGSAFPLFKTTINDLEKESPSNNRKQDINPAHHVGEMIKDSVNPVQMGLLILLTVILTTGTIFSRKDFLNKAA